MNPDDLALDDRDLRDVFAAAALVGLLAGKLVTPQHADPPFHPGVIVVGDAATLAYQTADAMMIARDAHK